MATINIGGVVEEIRIPEQRIYDDVPFPLVLTPVSKDAMSPQDACNFIDTHKGDLEDLLVRHGAIMFRDFPIEDAQAFHNFVVAYGRETQDYKGSAIRLKVTSFVITANETPAHADILFHNEMAFLKDTPGIVFFYCDIPPTKGGQTAVAPGWLIYDRLKEVQPQFVKDSEEKGVLYTWYHPYEDDVSNSIGVSWRTKYKTEDPEEAERKANELGFTCEWMPNGDVKVTTGPWPAVRMGPRNAKVWFNMILALYRDWEQNKKNILEPPMTFGDGSPLPPEAIDDIERIMNDLAADVTWKENDVMIVDNIQVQHARRWFVPPRRILVALGK